MTFLCVFALRLVVNSVEAFNRSPAHIAEVRIHAQLVAARSAILHIMPTQTVQDIIRHGFHWFAINGRFVAHCGKKFLRIRQCHGNVLHSPIFRFHCARCQVGNDALPVVSVHVSPFCRGYAAPARLVGQISFSSTLAQTLGLLFNSDTVLSASPFVAKNPVLLTPTYG